MIDAKYGSDEWIFIKAKSLGDKVVLRHLWSSERVELSREEYEKSWKLWWKGRQEQKW